ncbi:MAG: TolC family protein [Isosphaera sp.]|nr:TolC family protein [Isosphaera sp.]
MPQTRPRTRAAAAVVLASVLGFAGCQTAPPAPDRTTVAVHLAQRVGHTLPRHPSPPAELALPPGASFDDGLTEDEAVAVALWNNALFQEQLVDLGLTRGDLIQAGLLPNPEVLLTPAIPDRAFRYAFEFALESLWLRPIRVRSAAREADRTADRLAQAGLDLMRDVRQAYADVALARERVRVAGEAVKLRGRVAELAERRLRAGDISPQEAATARIDALQAEQDAARIGYDVPVLEERLRNLMGTPALRGPLALDPSPPPPCLALDVDALTQEALATRPDALAAAEAVAAAEARVTFAKIGWVRVIGIGDATSGRRNGNELGPGVRFTVPLFNRNQGGIARAEAELDQAVRRQQTVANGIVLDVQRAYLQYRQACAELDVLRTKVRPEVETAIRRAQAAYQEGNVTIFVVLETTRQLLDNMLRDAVLTADLRRTWAELERGVGRRLAATDRADEPAPPPPAPPVVRPEPIVPRQEVTADEPKWTPARARP